MFSFIKNFYYPSRLLTNSEFELICTDATVLEQDERGVKVLQLTSGDMLKIFRVKRAFSGANIYSYARRFCRNAARLNGLVIPTVEIKSLFHLERSGHTAVLYKPLQGESIRNLVKQDKNRMQQTAENLGIFLSALHEKGIHFHSLHTGNILLLPNNGFGLIDISDMTIYPWALNCSTRLRSFKRLCKYQEDFNLLGINYWQSMLSAYLEMAQISSRCKERLSKFHPF